jgi:hypothetical protein
MPDQRNVQREEPTVSKARTTFGAIIGALVISLVAAWPAQADPTIAGSATIKPGTQQFGNTLCATPDDEPSCYDRQYWRLNGTAGDRVTINWQHASGSYTDYVSELNVWPAGTDDFSLNNSDEIFSFYIGDNDRAQSVFTLPQSGTFPIEFESDCWDCGGPYDFSTTVEHAVKLFIASPARKARISRNATVSVSVRNPDGAALSGLPVKLTGTWKNKTRRLGTVTSANGAATFAVQLPRSARKRWVKLRASFGGTTGYLSARSTTVKVRVTR